MKRWFCNSVVILSTITTCIMLNIILSEDSYQNSNEEKLIIVKENEGSSNKVQNGFVKKEKERSKVDKIDKEDLEVNENEIISKKDDFRISRQEYFKEMEEYYNGDISDVDLDDYKSVFKVDSRTIVNSLSMMDKLKLLSISSKLSKVDYKKIDGYLKEDNAEEGVKKAYKVLKEKLNDKDMNKIKEILENYIDVNIIEKK